MRARTDISQISLDVTTAWYTLKANLPIELEDQMAEVETFIAIALRVMAKTNPSKIRDVAMTVNIQYLMKKQEQQKALERSGQK